MDNSVNIYIIDLLFSMCILEVLVEESVSQNIYLGPILLQAVYFHRLSNGKLVTRFMI